jgi:hypothetical protein
MADTPSDVGQLRQIATKAASEQSTPNREKRPRKLGEVTKRTSALGMSNANELTYSLNSEDAAGQCSARDSKVFALARNLARSFSAETERAASWHFFARRRYSSGFFVFLYVMNSYWFLVIAAARSLLPI